MINVLGSLRASAVPRLHTPGGEGGAAIVEFSIIFVPAFFFFAVIFDTGQLLYAKNRLQSASQDIGRQAAVNLALRNPSSSEAVTARTELQNELQQQLSQISNLTDIVATVSGPHDSTADGQSTVDISVQARFTTFFYSLTPVQTIDISSRIAVRYELQVERTVFTGTDYLYC